MNQSEKEKQKATLLSSVNSLSESEGEEEEEEEEEEEDDSFFFFLLAFLEPLSFLESTSFFFLPEPLFFFLLLGGSSSEEEGEGEDEIAILLGVFFLLGVFPSGLLSDDLLVADLVAILEGAEGEEGGMLNTGVEFIDWVIN
jgi:hypothetical protein